MQNSFPHFRKIEVELTKEQELEKIPEGPSEYFYVTCESNVTWNVKLLYLARPGALLFTVGLLHPQGGSRVTLSDFNSKRTFD